MRSFQDCTNLRVFKFEVKGESGEDGDPGPDPYPRVKEEQRKKSGSSGTS